MAQTLFAVEVWAMNLKKGALFLAFIGVIAALYFLTPIRHYFSQEGFQQVQVWIQQQGLLAPFIFGVIYVTATVLVLPGSVLTIGGGVIFGSLWGTVINLLSATGGALLSFFIARYLGRDVVSKLFRGKQNLEDIDMKLGSKGFYLILYLRLVPLFPFNALNYGLGLTKVSFRDYALATIVGMIPGTFVYTSLGAVGRHINLSDPATWTDYRVWGPFALVMLLSLLPKFVKKS
jgi:uncharacterized membrane protein YdjX (TVP38/TMEM64 family)